MNHLNPKHSSGQVKRLARAYHRRFGYALGASLSVEDLEQELWVIWHKTSQTFDPSFGTDFAHLFAVAARNRVYGMVKFHNKRTDMIGASLSDQVGTDEKSELIEMFADEHAETGEEILAKKQHAAWIMSQMDPRLRTMVEILLEQPQVFLDEVEGLMAKAERAAEMGVRVQLPRRITLNMLTEMFGLSRCTRYRLLDEMKEVMEHA